MPTSGAPFSSVKLRYPFTSDGSGNNCEGSGFQRTTPPASPTHRVPFESPNSDAAPPNGADSSEHSCALIATRHTSDRVDPGEFKLIQM